MKPEPCQLRSAGGLGPTELKCAPPPSYRARKLLFCRSLLQRHLHHHRRLAEPEVPSSTSFLVSIPPPEGHSVARDILLDLWTRFRRKGRQPAAAAHRNEHWQLGPRVCAPDLDQGILFEGRPSDRSRLNSPLGLSRGLRTKTAASKHGQRSDQPAVAGGNTRPVGPDRAVPVLLVAARQPAAARLALADEAARGRRREDTADVPTGGPEDHPVGPTAQRGQHCGHDGEDTLREDGDGKLSAPAFVYLPEGAYGLYVHL